ncbi:hypothetical protein [Rhodopirellula bahusiensis]|uniref:Uncharacterized protein n=1 Tax=Rhodopirellula bahusiensis TaxID=2014065 RepID=A0A2G1VYI3_9BACT|nr:hypothetical protein [Rhodopirellula bahusiensis]PHQ31795.1 hypothetical protein CEE69_29295 [Rhodopirellula bahusiensis]
MKSIVSQFTTDDYVSMLPPASRQLAIQRLAMVQNPADLIAEVAAQPGTGLATKGQSLWPRELVEQISKEIYLVICTEDEKYADLRKKVKEQKEISATVLITLMSSTIATYVDAMAAMCVPLVTWIMAALSKTGVEGWCLAFSKQAGNGEQKSDVTKEPGTDGSPGTTGIQ